MARSSMQRCAWLLAPFLFGSCAKAPPPAPAPAPAPPPAPVDSIRFSSLKAGEELEVSFVSEGCFSTDRYRLIFHGGAPISAEVYTCRNHACAKDDRAPPRATQHLLGTLNLDPREVARLDNLLSHYRTLPTGGPSCTTEETFDMQARRGGQSVKNEHFVDGTCAHLVLSSHPIHALVQKLSSPHAPNEERDAKVP